jgi:hypothetical protein
LTFKARNNLWCLAGRPACFGGMAVFMFRNVFYCRKAVNRIFEKIIKFLFDTPKLIIYIRPMKTFLLVSMAVVLAAAIVAGLTRLIFWKYYE